MNERTFTFHISSYDVEKLLPQLSEALEKRFALLARERHPRLWRATDKLNAQNEARNYSPVLSRTKSILFLLVGIFLLVPGLMKPEELLVPLIFGLIGLVAGVRGLIGNRKPSLKRMKRRFDASAKQLLAGKALLTEEDCVDIAFAEAEMIYPTGNGEEKTVAYDMFESVVEADDLYLFVFDTSVTVLQKVDLLGGDYEAFNVFLKERITHFVAKDE